MKLKDKVLAEFAEMGVKPHVYHILPINHILIDNTWMPNAVTIASAKALDVDCIREDIVNVELTWHVTSHSAESVVKQRLGQRYGGIAICDHRDQFSRKRGWIIACGRLLKHLQEAKEQ